MRQTSEVREKEKTERERTLCDGAGKRKGESKRKIGGRGIHQRNKPFVIESAQCPDQK